MQDQGRESLSLGELLQHSLGVDADPVGRVVAGQRRDGFEEGRPLGFGKRVGDIPDGLEAQLQQQPALFECFDLGLGLGPGEIQGGAILSGLADRVAKDLQSLQPVLADQRTGRVVADDGVGVG